MPDIHVSHVENAALGTGLGSKGVGEAGTLGAPAAIWCALNDALRPLDVQICKQPFTPAQIIQTLNSKNGLSKLEKL